MTPLNTNNATGTPSQIINDRVDNFGDQRKQSEVAPKVSSREAETQPLLSQLPPRTEKPSAIALKVTYFLIRTADGLGMPWAVKQLLQLNLGDVVSAVEFGADHNVLNTFLAEKQTLDPEACKKLKAAMLTVSLNRAIFLTQFLHPELNTLVADQKGSEITAALNRIQNISDRKFLAGAFLMRAIARNRMTSALALINSGAAIDNSTFSTSNALILAVQYGRGEVINELLQDCKDGKIPVDYLNARTSDGYNALIMAVSCDDTAVFTALLNAGADLKHTLFGPTAYEYALDLGKLHFCSICIAHEKPATAKKAMAFIKDAINLFDLDKKPSINPGNSLEFIVRKLCRDCLPPHEVNVFIKEIIGRLLKHWFLESVKMRPLIQALFDAITPLSESDLLEIKTAFLPEVDSVNIYSPKLWLKQIVQECQVSSWAAALGHLQHGSFDNFDKLLSTETAVVVDQKKNKPDVDMCFNNLFLSLEKIRRASTSQELKEACMPLPGHLIGKLINIPVRAKETAETLRKELKSEKSRPLHLVDANGRKFDIEDKDELSRLEVQLFAFEVENLLTEIENNVSKEPQLDKTSSNGDDYKKALADYEQRLVASQQARDLLQVLQPAAALAAPFQLRLVDDKLIDGLLQEVGNGQITMVAALKVLDAEQEKAGLSTWVESDISEPLRNWAVPQFLVPSERIRLAQNMASHV